MCATRCARSFLLPLLLLVLFESVIVWWHEVLLNEDCVVKQNHYCSKEIRLEIYHLKDLPFSYWDQKFNWFISGSYSNTYSNLALTSNLIILENNRLTMLELVVFIFQNDLTWKSYAKVNMNINRLPKYLAELTQLVFNLKNLIEEKRNHKCFLII